MALESIQGFTQTQLLNQATGGMNTLKLPNQLGLNSQQSSDINSSSSFSEISPLQRLGVDSVSQSNQIQDLSSNSPGFSEILSKLTQTVDNSGKAADQAFEDIITGKSDNITKAMLLKKNHQVWFKLNVEVVNTLRDGLQEIMRMNV